MHRATLLALSLVLSLSSVVAKPCAGHDLAPDHPLHIAVLEKPSAKFSKKRGQLTVVLSPSAD